MRRRRARTMRARRRIWLSWTLSSEGRVVTTTKADSSALVAFSSRAPGAPHAGSCLRLRSAATRPGGPAPGPTPSAYRGIIMACNHAGCDAIVMVKADSAPSGALAHCEAGTGWGCRARRSCRIVDPIGSRSRMHRRRLMQSARHGALAARPRSSTAMRVRAKSSCGSSRSIRRRIASWALLRLPC